MGRSLRGGSSRSKQRRKAITLPPWASSTAFRVRASASPSSKAWVARVALFKAPLGRPWGLPLCPLTKGRPLDFCAAFAVKSSLLLFISPSSPPLKLTHQPPGESPARSKWAGRPYGPGPARRPGLLSSPSSKSMRFWPGKPNHYWIESSSFALSVS